MKHFVFILFISSILLSFISCKNDTKIVEPIKIEFKKEGTLSLYKSTSNSIITTLDIEISDTDYETQTGLMHRHNMLDNRGMLFVFDNIKLRFFYMKNTYLPLDIIYLDEAKLIVSFQKNAKPLDKTALPSQVPAKYVLEINAGLADKFNLAIGDKMEYNTNNKINITHILSLHKPPNGFDWQ